MRGLFALSYGLLWALIVLEALLLREVLRKTVWLKRLLADVNRRSTVGEISWLRTGAPVPDFTAPLLGAGGSLNTSQLKGHPCILLFVSPEAASPLYENLAAAIHGMWHKAQGRLYLVCNGAAESCRQFARDNLVHEMTEDHLPVILDEGGRIAESFLISSTPQAVELDEYLRVKRYGRPEPAALGDGGGDGHRTGREDDPQPATTTGSRSETGKADEGIGAPDVGGGGERPCDWPDDLPSTGASFARVDTTVSCVMTRFRLRSVWSLVPFYLAFRRVRRSSRDVAGLLKAVFFIEDLHTCYTMSLWRDECAIVEFGRVQAHVNAANAAFRPTWRKDLRRAEIWSAQFRLWAVSAHNLNWEGLDLQTVLADQWERREQVARGEFFGEEISHNG